MPFRPKSLKEVSQHASSLEAWGFALAEFLDEVNARRKVGDRQELGSLVSDEPSVLRQLFQAGDTADAFAAALAEYLAESVPFPAPTWTRKPDRFLSHAWYPLPNMADHPQLRALIEAQTPRSFREHNIFIDENSLVRV